jgi:hypothetical protein
MSFTRDYFQFWNDIASHFIHHIPSSELKYDSNRSYPDRFLKRMKFSIMIRHFFLYARLLGHFPMEATRVGIIAEQGAT